MHLRAAFGVLTVRGAGGIRPNRVQMKHRCRESKRDEARSGHAVQSRCRPRQTEAVGRLTCAPTKNRRSTLATTVPNLTIFFEHYESGRPDSNRRRPAWEGGGKPKTDFVGHQFSSEEVMPDALCAKTLAQQRPLCGPLRPPDTFSPRRVPPITRTVRSASGVSKSSRSIESAWIISSPTQPVVHLQ
jgi:hypothetical protein